MNADSVAIEWDEGGCSLVVVTAEETYSFVLPNPELLHRVVVEEIGGWITEGEQARREFNAARREEETFDYLGPDPNDPDGGESWGPLAMKEDA